MVDYEFNEFDRVRSTEDFMRTGEVTVRVPGNGTFPWYFVRWDDGGSGRYTEGELEPE